jgi:hypothetical protein
LVAEQEREILLQRWTEFPWSALDGKSPAEAARDPAYQVRVLAAIALLETETATRMRRFDFNELRAALGLPTRDLLDPAGSDIRSLPLVRLGRVDTAKLSESELLDGFRRLALKNHRPALHRFAREMLARQTFTEEITKDRIYDVLISASSTSEEALRYATEAREDTAREGKSPAHWLLAELSIRIGRLEGEEANRILQTLRSRHLREPGVAQQLRDILVAYGIITPDGQPAAARPPEQAAAAAVTSPAEDAKRIWTPGESGPPAETAAAPSKLWVPGRD